MRYSQRHQPQELIMAYGKKGKKMPKPPKR
jgi:hypothetical protein